MINVDVCGLIFKENELDNRKINDMFAALSIREFLKKYGNELDDRIPYEIGMDKLLKLKNDIIYRTDKLTKPFFDILEKYDYNMRQELVFAINCLGLLAEPENNSELIEFLLHSPVIQDISFDGDRKFSICSERFGDFSFELAYRYFENNELLRTYIKYSELPQNCHAHTQFVADVFPEMYSVSSLCQDYFRGNYYHSYTYDKEKDVVIDLSSNAVMDRQQYYSIFKPNEICSILNGDLEYEIFIAEERSAQPEERMGLAKLFLYKQYLAQIGYEGDYVDAPYVKTKNN